MAIRIVDGVPGAGKTYFAVDHCLKSFYSFDDVTDKWIPKESGTTLVTNIESFAFGVSLEQELESTCGDIERYFNYEFLADRFQDKRVIFIIDEAQALFHTKFFNKDVFLFFQKHRHLGIDIYLVTQDVALIAKSIRALAEYHICAVRRTMSLLGEFRYKFVDPTSGQTWKTKILKRDFRVFAVYKSMVQTESETIKSVPLKFITIVIVLLVVCVGGFAAFVKYRYFKAAEAEAAAASTPKKDEGSRSSQGEIVNRGANVAQTFSPLPVENGVGAVLTGRFSSDDGSVNILSVGGAQYRLTEEQILAACKCHPDLLQVGVPFLVYGAFVAAGARGGRLVRSPCAKCVGAECRLGCQPMRQDKFICPFRSRMAWYTASSVGVLGSWDNGASCFTASSHSRQINRTPSRMNCRLVLLRCLHTQQRVLFPAILVNLRVDDESAVITNKLPLAGTVQGFPVQVGRNIKRKVTYRTTEIVHLKTSLKNTFFAPSRRPGANLSSEGGFHLDCGSCAGAGLVGRGVGAGAAFGVEGGSSSSSGSLILIVERFSTE